MGLYLLFMVHNFILRGKRLLTEVQCRICFLVQDQYQSIAKTVTNHASSLIINFYSQKMRDESPRVGRPRKGTQRKSKERPER